MTATVPAPHSAAADRTEGRGPGLVVPALVTVVLFVASVVATLAFGNGLYSSPFVAQPADIAQTYADSSTLIRTVGLLEFASAIALLVFTVVVWTRLRTAAPGLTVVSDVAAFGGVLAALFMVLNALVQWPLSYPSVSASQPVRHSLEFLYFGLGGFAHVATLGLLVGGVSLVGLVVRLTPRWLAVAGLVLGAASLLSALTFVFEGAAVLLPIGRFLTFAWLIALSISFRPRTTE